MHPATAEICLEDLSPSQDVCGRSVSAASLYLRLRMEPVRHLADPGDVR